MTPDRMWITAPPAAMSGFLMSALPTATPFTPFFIVTGPLRVSTSMFFMLACMILPAWTCNLRASAVSMSAVMPAASKALSSGANTVPANPAPRAPSSPLALRAARSTLKEHGGLLPTWMDCGPVPARRSTTFRRAITSARLAWRFPALAAPSRATAPPSAKQAPAVLPRSPAAADVGALPTCTARSATGAARAPPRVVKAVEAP
mmetsp:Transcript_21970/g.58018  ORF Transcript_21970/g.58018 Transcript_21970/m.58018 type:complete len:205 (+) Transcript_21970:321-935(+)